MGRKKNPAKLSKRGVKRHKKMALTVKDHEQVQNGLWDLREEKRREERKRETEQSRLAARRRLKTRGSSWHRVPVEKAETVTHPTLIIQKPREETCLQITTTPTPSIFLPSLPASHTAFLPVEGSATAPPLQPGDPAQWRERCWQ